MKSTISPFLTLTNIPAAVGVQTGRLCDFGFLMLRKAQFGQALERFELVLRDEPDCVAAWLGRAKALQGMGRFELALRDVERAEALVTMPNSRLLLLRAKLLMMLRRYDLADGACRMALVLEPGLLGVQWLRLQLWFASSSGKKMWKKHHSSSRNGTKSTKINGGAFLTESVPIVVEVQ